MRVVAGATVGGTARLTADAPAATIELSGRPGQIVELQADRVFSPCWDGATDPRLLSFTLDVP